MTETSYVGSHTFHVSGMTCDHCRRAVTAELSAGPGIDSVQVDLGTGRVDITTSRPVPATQIAAAVDEAGYAVDAR